MMAQVDHTEIGITPCMPILKQPDLKQDPRFFGAHCVDILLSCDIDHFQQDIETKSFIFKSDENFDQATQQKTFLSFDSMKAEQRQQLLMDSKFFKDLSTNFAADTSFSDSGKLLIDEFKIGADPARLFNGQYVQWGTMKLKSAEINYRKQNKDLDFMFVIEDINLEFTSLDLNQLQANTP